MLKDWVTSCYHGLCSQVGGEQYWCFPICRVCFLFSDWSGAGGYNPKDTVPTLKMVRLELVFLGFFGFIWFFCWIFRKVIAVTIE